MSRGITLTRSFRAKRSPGRLQGQGVLDQQSTCVPRIARLMALAIYFDQLISEGVVADQAEIARLGHVSRSRVTQIMNLLNLAPDIQQEILQLETVGHSRDRMTERSLRSISALADWQEQRKRWNSFSRDPENKVGIKRCPFPDG